MLNLFFRDAKNFTWNGRRRMTSGHHNDCIPEEGSEASSEEDLEVYKSRSKIPISGNMQKGKPVSRSSSGIGTSSRQSNKKKDGSDETSSRGFSPPGKTEYFDEESDGDVQPVNSLRNGKKDKKKKVTPWQESKYSALKSLKKSLTKNKSKSKLELTTNNNSKKEKHIERYELAQKTPILDKYDLNTLQENDDEDFDSFSEEDGSYSFSDFDEHEDAKDQYSKVDKTKNQRTKSKRVTENYRSNSTINEDQYKTKKQNKDNVVNKAGSSKQDPYLKKYKGDIVYSSEDESDFEIEKNKAEKKARGNVKERKYSNQLKECSDYSSSRDELLTDKPAMNTLKKTFTNMLSKIPFTRNRADSSSISDNCSVMSKSSKAWDATSTLGRLSHMGSRTDKNSTKIGRANSTASVNIKKSGNILISFPLLMNIALRRTRKEDIHVFFF